MYVKDISVPLNQVGSQMKVCMSTPHQPIYKQVWSLGLQQVFKMPLLHTFIATDQHHSNLDNAFNADVGVVCTNEALPEEGE